jgi:hypothetical protein
LNCFSLGSLRPFGAGLAAFMTPYSRTWPFGPLYFGFAVCSNFDYVVGSRLISS